MREIFSHSKKWDLDGNCAKSGFGRNGSKAVKAARVVADMKSTVLKHGEIKTMLMIGRGFQKRVRVFAKEEEKAKEKKGEWKENGGKDNGDLEGFE